MGTTASLTLIPLLCHPTASGKDLGIPKSSPRNFRGVGDNLSVGDNLINASEHELGAGKSSDFSHLDPQF
jgi:hypothetical protein